ncbi:hypothetical protein GCM10025759_18340 [Lysobacter panacisoli]|uniref:Carboxypeptidase regulatory-like domain-containing protein n=2 Tax=Lysobacter panacisoli TaxID=1255263 RepID=A0ABP9LFC3_9GAMM
MGMTASRWRIAVPCLLGLLLVAGCKEVQDIREEMGWSKQREAPPPPPVVTLETHWLPSDSVVDGQSQAQWVVRWWQWAGRFGDEAPYADQDGSRCAMHQDGAVWFLAGTTGRGDAVRNCTIPAGRHVFVPLITWAIDGGDAGGGMSCEEKQAASARLADHVNTGLVLIDGRPVGQLQRMRVAAGDCFARSPDLPASSSDGYWLMLKPLPPGPHQLAITAAYKEGPRSMMQNFRYELDVQGDPDVSDGDEMVLDDAAETAATP